MLGVQFSCSQVHPGRLAGPWGRGYLLSGAQIHTDIKLPGSVEEEGVWEGGAGKQPSLRRFPSLESSCSSTPWDEDFGLHMAYGGKDKWEEWLYSLFDEDYGAETGRLSWESRRGPRLYCELTGSRHGRKALTQDRPLRLCSYCVEGYPSSCLLFATP